MRWRRLRHPGAMEAALQLLQQPRHQPFFWPGSSAAALLIHGFPGTPAEMRPLAELLRPMGWTVQGLLLPGFGAELASGRKHCYEEWLAVIIQASAALRSTHCPVVLVGYSMGAALALSAAALSPPDGLILLAPFVLEKRWAYNMAAGMLGRLSPRYIRPFGRANFTDPTMRTMLFSLVPDMDSDDLRAQVAIRELVVPVSLLQQVVRAGWQAYLRAPRVQTPTLVVQGQQDETATPWRTRALVARLAGPVRLLEVQAGHRLIGTGNLAWPTVQEAIMGFAARLEEGPSEP